MAGTSVSAWRRPARRLEQGDDALVPADGDAHLLGGRLDAEDQHGTRHGATARSSSSQRAAHCAPPGVTTMSRVTGTPRRRRRPTSSVGVRRHETHLEVLAEPRRHHVTPLDQHDAVELGELAERQVGDLGVLLEAVDVGVVQRHRRRVVRVHEGERRRRDRLGHTERPAEALGERRLAGAHLPGEHDHVAGAAEPGDGGGDRRGSRPATVRAASGGRTAACERPILETRRLCQEDRRHGSCFLTQTTSAPPT